MATCVCCDLFSGPEHDLDSIMKGKHCAPHCRIVSVLGDDADLISSSVSRLIRPPSQDVFCLISVCFSYM